MRRTVFRIGLNIPPVIKSRFKGRSFVEVNQPTSRSYGWLTHVPFDDNKVQERRAITDKCPLRKFAFHHKFHSRPTSKAPDSQRDVLYHINSCTSRWADVQEVWTGNPGGGNAHKNPLIIQGVQRELQRPQLMYAPLSINKFAPKTIEGGPPCCYTKKEIQFER